MKHDRPDLETVLVILSALALSVAVLGMLFT
jgi:hypothetical protein